MRVAALIGVALAAGVAIVMALLGFDPANIVLAAIATATAAVLLGQRGLTHEHGLPPLPTVGRAGHRHEVAQLSWSLAGPDGRVTVQGMRHLRDVAAGRLATAGIDPHDDDAVRAALGDGALRTLRATGRPRAQALDACLTALERLEGALP